MAALWRDPCWLLTGGSVRPVNLRSGLTYAKARCKEKKISPEVAGKKGIEEWVGAGVDRIEEDQQEFGI